MSHLLLTSTLWLVSVVAWLAVWLAKGFMFTVGALWAYHYFWQLLERLP